MLVLSAAKLSSYVAITEHSTYVDRLTINIILFNFVIYDDTHNNYDSTKAAQKRN